MKDATSQVLADRLGGSWSLQALDSSAFCVTWRAVRAGGSGAAEALFVKSTAFAQATMLQAEADGLAALAAADCIRVPAVAGCWAEAGPDRAVLAMAWLDLVPATTRDNGGRFGRQLGALHRLAAPQGEGRFGWRRDNWLGLTPQRNRWSDAGGLAGWLAFFADERLGALAERLAAAGQAPALVDAVRRVIDALPGCFDDGHVPRASLIHGDLWSGNWAASPDGAPVVFDPAVSVSDAEAELAMLELFGAPPAGFWPAYREAAGLHPGYPRRRGLYQLYHLLNHALLFGSGYARQAMALAEALSKRP